MGFSVFRHVINSWMQKSILDLCLVMRYWLDSSLWQYGHALELMLVFLMFVNMAGPVNEKIIKNG